MQHAIFRRRPTQALVFFLVWLSLALQSAKAASPYNQFMMQVGPYVHHWSYSEDHNDWPMLVGAEWENKGRWELGAAAFKNSFYQPSIYFYAGRRWFLPAVDDQLYVKLTGGPLYGYRDKYEKKVPLNYNGLSLAILPAVGYQMGRANVQAVILGKAAVVFTVGYQFN